LFYGDIGQLLAKGFIGRGGQIIDPTLIPAPHQKILWEERDIINPQALCEPAQRRQKF